MSDAVLEHVLVIPTELFHRLGYFQGFSGDVQRYLADLLRAEHLSYRPRREMETDPRFKQLIPYVILCYRDPDGCQNVFQYTRGPGQGEERLRQKRSVGIGGHICRLDRGTQVGSDPYRTGMQRELQEEVFIDAPYTDRCVGLINDDLTEVGRVHLGVVHRFDLQRPAVRPREPEILECGFRPVEQILKDLSGFESWSQICLRALFSSGSPLRV
ncbi:MAG: phosphoesterase [Thermoguttaceae bacterium]